MRFLPTDDQLKNWGGNLRRYMMPFLFLLLPVALSKGDWSQVRVLLVFLSILAGAAWCFFLMLSEREGKGLLPDFSLKPLLKRAEEDAIAAAIVVAAFFGMFCTFLVIVANLVAPH